MPKREPVLVYSYSGCDACKKALRWLTERRIAHRVVPIVESPPTAEALLRMISKSGLPARRWFNTSGRSYRGLAAKLGKPAVEALGDAEIVALLARDGKMIKRPVVVDGDLVLLGFREDEWAALEGGPRAPR
jgi:arsenate reductase